MPVKERTKEEEAKFLRKYNLDPAHYTVYEGKVIRRSEISPGAAEDEDGGFLEDATAFGASALRGAPAAAAGIGTTLAVAGSGGLGLIPIGAGLLAGLGTSYGTDKAIQAVSPELSESLAGLRERNPYVSVLGEGASALAGGFGFSAPNVLRAGRTASQVFKRQAIDKVAKANLLNVGAGAVSAPAIRAGIDLASGNPLDPKTLALDAVSGALYNKPFGGIAGRLQPPEDIPITARNRLLPEQGTPDVVPGKQPLPPQRQVPRSSASGEVRVAEASLLPKQKLLTATSEATEQARLNKGRKFDEEEFDRITTENFKRDAEQRTQLAANEIEQLSSEPRRLNREVPFNPAIQRQLVEGTEQLSLDQLNRQRLNKAGVLPRAGIKRALPGEVQQKGQDLAQARADVIRETELRTSLRNRLRQAESNNEPALLTAKRTARLQREVISENRAAAELEAIGFVPQRKVSGQLQHLAPAQPKPFLAPKILQPHNPKASVKNRAAVNGPTNFLEDMAARLKRAAHKEDHSLPPETTDILIPANTAAKVFATREATKRGKAFASGDASKLKLATSAQKAEQLIKAGLKVKGIKIKINPQASEAGFINMEILEPMVTWTKNAMVNGITSFSRFLQHAIDTFGDAIKHYAKAAWDVVNGKISSPIKQTQAAKTKIRKNIEDAQKAWDIIDDRIPTHENSRPPKTTNLWNLLGAARSATEQLWLGGRTHRYFSNVANNFFRTARRNDGRYVTGPRSDAIRILRTNAANTKGSVSKSTHKISSLFQQLDDDVAKRMHNVEDHISYAKNNDVFDPITKKNLGKLDDAELEVYSIYRKQVLLASRKEQNELNIPVMDRKGDLRAARTDPHYFPNQPNKRLQDVFINGEKGSEEYRAVRKEFIDWIDERSQIKYGKLAKDDNTYRKNAAKGFDDASASYRSTNTLKLGENFGPIDKVEGLGLPPSLREQDFFAVMDKFGGRVGKRLAFAKEIGNDKLALAAIGRKYVNELGEGKSKLVGDQFFPDDSAGKGERVQNIGSDANVQAIMRAIDGTFDQTSKGFETFNRLVKSFIMGGLTGTRDTLTSQVLSMAYITPQQIPGVLKTMMSFGNIKKALSDSRYAGVNPHSIGQMESINFQENNVLDAINKISDVGNKIQGRQMLENLVRATELNKGGFITNDNFLAAMMNGLDEKGIIKGIGGKTRTRFLNDFAPGWRQHLPQKSLGKLTKAEQSKVKLPDDMVLEASARYVEDIQGTYQLDNLPRWSQEGATAVFASLARWSIEKSNNLSKRVISPLMNEGDMMPLMMTLGSATLGGAAVNTIVNSITGRKQKAPTMKELHAAYDPGKGFVENSPLLDDLWYKVASLVQASGYGGIVSDAAYQATRMMQGDNSLGLLESPLVEATRANVSLFVNAGEALADGEVDVGLTFLSEFLSANIQSARLIRNKASKERRESIDRSNKFRDLKVFKRLEGQDIESLPFANDPFENKETKRFKRTSSLQEARPLARKLVKDEVQATKGNPELLSRRLSGLRSITDRSLPSPNSSPREFRRYFKFLSETQGSEIAQQRFKEFRLQQRINERKKSLIPRF